VFLGAALTSAESSELQEVIAETDVSISAICFAVSIQYSRSMEM
jgi:hypothetical protein